METLLVCHISAGREGISQASKRDQETITLRPLSGSDAEGGH